MSSGTLSVSARSRPISVDLPSSTEPHATTRTIGCSASALSSSAVRRGVTPVGVMVVVISEVPLGLLALHRSAALAVDQPSGALRAAIDQHLGQQVVEVGRLGLHRGGQGVAAEGAEADLALLRPLAVLERVAVVVDHDQLPVALDDRA